MRNVQANAVIRLFFASIAVYVTTVIGDSGSGACDSAADHDSLGGCTLQGIKSNTLRVVYLDKQYVTQNKVVISMMEKLNQSYVYARTCERLATAVPEWYAVMKLRRILDALMHDFAAL
jgi:hypothetical protein